MFKLSQETTAIVTVGLTILGSNLYATNILQDRINRVENEIRTLRADTRNDVAALRAEGRADRDTIHAEGRADREAIRAEARADREAIRAEARADREAFEKHITRLTQEQSKLSGIVEQMRTAGR